MIPAFAIAIHSDAMQGLDDIDPAARRAAQQAINKTVERARATAAREMRAQVNFPAQYLSGTNGRLSITKRADAMDLEAIVTGRHRPTSLARFAVVARRGPTPGARVAVNPGLARHMPRAFFVNLRSGNTDTKNNLGLAIRLEEGMRPSRAFKPKEVSPGLFLLYGPSIDQVFDDVAVEISPAMADFLGDEFLRLLELKRSGRMDA